MTTLEELVARYAGQAVPVSYNVGFVVLSYVVSLLGAGSTLELINRRTSFKGLYNHFLLVSAAISMGGIAIWSMHFIANRAIILVNGQLEVQIAYSTAITVVSFFVPILVLLLAFLAVNYRSSEVQWWRIFVSGFLSGGAICGMHYLGDAAISNYRCRYVTANVVGAAVIAVAASTVALTLFFVFRAAWTNSWLRRMGCMVLLAVAVSGMHWCASLGTQFVLLNSAVDDSDSRSRNTTTIIVVCLAAAASVILVIISVLSARTMKNYAIKAQQVVLAVAVFDRHGRILVSPDGLIPSEKVTETFPQKSHDDVFTTAHPLFHWMFRASRNWSSICTLLPWMMTHLDSLPRTIHRGRSGTRLFEENGQLVDNHDIIFRELFCLAADTLATRMAENIQDVGTLWGEIFHTGIEIRPAIRLSETFDVMNRAAENGEEAKDPSQLERGLSVRNDGYGRGSLMFLVRHIDSTSEVARLEAAGYRFAETHRVVEIIKSSMQIKTRRLAEKLRDMARHSEYDGGLTPGVRVGLFAVRARLDRFGFDVMVEHDVQTALPTSKLPYVQLESWQLELLKQVEGLPLQTLLIRLAMIQKGPKREVEFAGQLRTCIKKLRDDVDDSCIDSAVLSSKVSEVPCLQPHTATPGICTLITLQVVLDINTRVQSRRYDFLPLQFFKVHQMVQDNSPHQAAFSRALHREMATIMNACPAPQAATPRLVRRTTSHSSSIANLYQPQDSLSHASGRTSPAFEEPEPAKASSSSSATPAPASAAKPSLFGGIVVSQEIAIEVAEAPAEKAAGSPISGRLNFPSRTRGTLRKGALRLASSASASASPADAGSRRKAAPVQPIEMSRVKTQTPTAALLGGNNFDFNVEASEKDREVATFVDELFASCVASIRG